MDIIQAIKLDFQSEQEKLSEVSDAVSGDSFCHPEALAEFANRFRSERAALQNTLFAQNLGSECLQDIKKINEANGRIESLLSDLEQTNCAENDYLDRLATLSTELNERNSLAYALFDKIEKEIPIGKRGDLLTDYERYRETKAEGSPFQASDRPHDISPYQELDRFT